MYWYFISFLKAGVRLSVIDGRNIALIFEMLHLNIVGSPKENWWRQRRDEEMTRNSHQEKEKKKGMYSQKNIIHIIISVATSLWSGFNNRRHELVFLSR